MSWSPDGNTIVYARDIGDAREFVFLDMDQTLDLDAYPKNFPDIGIKADFVGAPAWSPDGGVIVFHAQFGIEAHIYLVEVVSGYLTQITHRPGTHYYPQWRPDGQRITYTSSDLDGSNFDIYAINIDGTEDVPVVATPDDERASAWIP